MKKVFWPAAVILFLVGCAHRQAESEAYGGTGDLFLGDCSYSDICGPGLYGDYFYYTPFFPAGPLTPARLRVDLVAHHPPVRVVGHYGSSGYGVSISEGSVSTTDRSAPVPAPGPPAVHTVSPRN